LRALSRQPPPRSLPLHWNPPPLPHPRPQQKIQGLIFRFVILSHRRRIPALCLFLCHPRTLSFVIPAGDLRLLFARHPDKGDHQHAPQSKDLHPTSIHHRLSTPSHPHSVILSGAAHVSVLRSRRTCSQVDPPPPIDGFSPSLCHPERSSTRQCAAQSKDLQPSSIPHRLSTPSQQHSVILSGAAHVSVLRSRRTCSQLRSTTAYRRLLTQARSFWTAQRVQNPRIVFRFCLSF